MSELSDQQRAAICAAARAYLDTPWRGQGRDRMGIDCVGLVECAYVDAGLPLERTPATYRGIDSKLLMSVLRRFFRPISLALARPADLVVYRMLETREAHLVMLVPPRIPGHPLNGIHCPANAKAVEARFDPRRGVIGGVYTWQ